MIKAIVIRKENGNETKISERQFWSLEDFNRFRTVVEDRDWSLTVRMHIC